MVVLDRKDEKKSLKNIVSSINDGDACCVWIEGKSGVGKTHFLKYALDKIDVPIFRQWGVEPLFKCNDSRKLEDYAFVSRMLSTIIDEKPDDFFTFLERYLRDRSPHTILTALSLFLPNIKGFGWFAEYEKRVANPDVLQRKEVFENGGSSLLPLFFAEAMLYMFKKVYEFQQVVICIDDVMWLDEQSRETLDALLSKNKAADNRIRISFFTTSREENDPDIDSSSYSKTYALFKNHYDPVDFIYISNFDLKTTCELLEETGRYELKNYSREIFSITNGNPQELDKTLRFNDNEIKKRLKKHSPIQNAEKRVERYFSKELIAKANLESEYALKALFICSVFEGGCSKQKIASLLNDIEMHVSNKILSTSSFKKSIELLDEYELIENSYGGIRIRHDSIKELVRDRFMMTGEIREFSILIAESLSRSMETEIIAKCNDVVIQMRLLCEHAPEKGFERYRELQNLDKSLIKPEVLHLAIECFCKSYELQSPEIVNKIAVPQLLRSAVLLSKFEQSEFLCKVLDHKFSQMTNENKINYLSNYIKTQVELGHLSSECSKNGAVDLHNRLMSQQFNNKDEVLLSHLLGMSVYEHILDYQMIEIQFKEARSIVCMAEEELSPYSLAMFYRNLGLIDSHCNLEKSYRKALTYAEQIPDEGLSNLICGTCQNNLALHYFYSAQIEKALEYFSLAREYINNSEHDSFRVLNNIAICHFMKGDLEEAFSLFLTAKSTSGTYPFEKLCVDINLSIAMFSLGEIDEAEKLLDDIIKQQKGGDNLVEDRLAYCTALINRAYMYFEKKDYLHACSLYDESLFFEYRFENERQILKREQMKDLSLALFFGDTPTKKLMTIDFKNKATDIFCKPYSLIPFAYYAV